MAKRFHVRTYGCQMNEHDSERIAGLLAADGMEHTDNVDDADVVVLNTCCIRENADNRLYGQLGHLKSAKDENPDLQIVVAGCLAQKDREIVQRRAPFVDVVVGTHNVERTGELLAASAAGPVMEILEESDAFPSALPAKRNEDHSAWVTIQIGCDNSCAFCIVPSVRGREISRPFGEILDEVRSLAAAGVVEITLLGQNVNSYGRDLALAHRSGAATADVEYLVGSAWMASDRRARPLFADLLIAVSAVDGIRRVRYTSPHPKDLRLETIEAMAATPEVCEHLHLPLQSGSDRVLTAMHRGYTAERYLERLAAARAAVPDLAVTTDIIVGFPGETEDDFVRTLEVVAAADYDSAYTFKYSPRPGTEAAEHRDLFVPHEVVSERFHRLEAVVERSAMRRHQARIGRVEEVLVEGTDARDPDVTRARTRQSKLVRLVPADGQTPDRLRVGTFALARIDHAGSHHLRGVVTEVTASPRHRIRIPVAAL